MCSSYSTVSIFDQATQPFVRGHVALFYESEDIRDEAIREFILEGLSHGDQVLYLVAPEVEGEVLNNLELRWGAAWEAYQQGRLLIGGLTDRDTFCPEMWTRYIQSELISGGNEDGRGVRVAVDMGWLLEDARGINHYLRYESQVESLLRGQSLTHLCLFNQSHLDPRFLLNALMCHPQVILDRELHENPLCVPPSHLTDLNQSRLVFDYLTACIRQRRLARVELSRYQESLETQARERAADLEAAQELLLHKTEERIRLLEDLSESENKYRSLFFGSHLVMLLIDSVTGEIVDANQAANRYYGYTRSQLIGMNIACINQLPAEQLFQAIHAAREKKRNHFLFKHTLANGEIRDVEVHTGPVVIRGRRLLYTQVHDLSQQKSLEAQLYQAQKMEAVGQLAGGVAHDFNNLISVIMGCSELALESLSESDPIHEELNEIMKAASRARSVTQQLLAFSRKQSLHQQVVDLNRVIKDVSKMLYRLVGENVQVDLDLDWRLDSVFVDPAQIQQILINLVVNSRDAMTHGGVVTIKTSNVELPENPETVRLGVPPGMYVLMEVSDTGRGIARELLNKVFDPFFTTKEEGKGTGLGLSTVQGIVQQHGGGITIVSEPGQGTSFQVYLPRSPKPAHVADKVVPFRAGAKPGEVVLIVEDEDIVRNVTRNVLRKYGYEVLEARGAREALDVLGFADHGVHLLLADVVMPGMNGWELYQQLLVKIPNLKAVFMSGHTDEILDRAGFSAQDLHFIHKPFIIEDLLGTVRSVLDES